MGKKKWFSSGKPTATYPASTQPCPRCGGTKKLNVYRQIPGRTTGVTELKTIPCPNAH